MIKLLVVDNERWIVEGLLELFKQADKPDLEVYGAYSGVEAMEWLRRMKFDIVLSDIRMPGMDGLQLQREVVRQWPWCKIIFLSGYDDFSYIQQVMRNGGVDYLLKTEGPDAILRAVKRAAEQLFAAVETEQLLRNAESQIRLARPLLLNEYMLELVRGENDSLRKMERKFDELQIPLRAEDEVHLAIGRVDDWRDDLTIADRELLLFAVRNIAEEYFAKSVRCLTVSPERNKLLWLLQPADAEAGSGDRTVRFIHGTLETVQMACKQLLKLDVSFAAAGTMKPWPHIPDQFGALNRLLARGLGMGRELILIDRGMTEDGQPEPGALTHETRSQLDKRNAMAAFLENGQRELYFAEFDKLIRLATAAKDPDGHLKLEAYYTLVSLLLAYMNRWDLHDEIGGAFDLGRLTRYDVHRSWDEAASYLTELSHRLFDQKLSDQLFMEDDLVKRIQHYVVHHLAGDLSLTRIGEVVGYNPNYLTRLYKRIANETLTDYIASARLDRAKKLLKEDRLTVQEISKAIGFLTEQSFYRFFKKATGHTPQEYRERREFSQTDRQK